MRESVKALLAVQVTLLMLFGCAARPPAPAPHNGATIATDLAVDQTLLKRGYRPRRINGQLKYCRSQILTGTRFSNTVCLTPEEISATDGDTQSNLDTLGRAGRALCPNNKCD